MYLANCYIIQVGVSLNSHIGLSRFLLPPGTVQAVMKAVEINPPERKMYQTSVGDSVYKQNVYHQKKTF